MGISYAAFLSSAQKLLGNAQSEVDYRNAASRGYLSAYHACSPLGKTLPDFVDVKGGVHERLIYQLTHAKEIKLKSLGYLLKACKISRKYADYELNEDFSKEEAAQVIGRTEEIFEKIRKL